MRLSHCVLVVLLFAVGFAVYNVADQYQSVEKKINRIRKKSEMEREAIRVMRADWAFLTNPSRMEKIAEQYFQLKPMTEKQIVTASTIPMRSVLDEQYGTGENTANDRMTSNAKAMPTAKTLPTIHPVVLSGGAR